MKNKVAFFEVKDWEKDYLENQLNDTEVSFFPEKISAENIGIAKDCQIISIFVDSKVSKDVADKLPNLKMIATRSTGFDHIDLEACKKNGVRVSNVPHYGDNAVAEYTFALILDLSRKIHQSIERVRNGEFSFQGLTGFDLKNKTIGIVGIGNIGSHVARIAQAFEMNVLAYDLRQDKKLSKKLGFKYVSLEELLNNSDIITLHVPYNKNTHYLINSGNINLIKKGSYLINTSRGGVVETDALIKALSKGIIAAAGLDVLEEENFIKEEVYLLSKEFSLKTDLKVVLENHILMEQDNVIITPHNAFNSKEALEKILEITVLNIKSFLANKPINLVD